MSLFARVQKGGQAAPSSSAFNRTWDPSGRLTAGIGSYDATKDAHLKFSIEAPQQRPKTREAFERLQSQVQRYDALLHGAPPAVLPPVKSKPPQLPPSVRPEAVFVAARDRLLTLWDALSVDESIRAHFRATAFTDVTAENINMMHAEIQRCLAIRRAEEATHEAIDVREGLLYLIGEQVERMAALSVDLAEIMEPTSADVNEAKAAVSIAERTTCALFNKLRKASLEVVAQTVAWREALGYPAIPLWRGTSYLRKMRTDLLHIVNSPLARCAGCALVDNPLLNPRKLVPLPIVEASSLSGISEVVFGSRRPPAKVPASALNVTAVEYQDAEQVIADEEGVWAAFVRSQAVVRFDAPDVSQADERIVREVARDCMFHAEEHEELSAEARAKAAFAEARRQDLLKRVVTIQRVMRGRLGREKAEREKKRKRAAVVVQTTWRRWAAVIELRRRRRRYYAAVTIQARQRGIAVRRRMTFFRAIQAAVTKVQKIIRGWLTRRRTAVLREAYEKTQRTRREEAMRQQAVAAAAEELRLQEAGATELQRVWRGVRQRQVGVGVPHRVHSAVVLQRFMWYAASSRVAFYLSHIEK